VSFVPTDGPDLTSNAGLYEAVGWIRGDIADVQKTLAELVGVLALMVKGANGACDVILADQMRRQGIVTIERVTEPAAGPPISDDPP